jgi:branched-chain amino acid transport system substrate-binding protein
VNAEEVRGVSDDTVKIGIIADQTGGAATATVPLTKGARMYFRHINDMGGINGRKVEIILEDDRYTIPGSFAAFKKLIFRDKVLSILLCGGTGQTLALMQQIEKYKVPVLPWSLADKMTIPLRRYIFTITASYDDGLKIIIDYIMKDMKAGNPRISYVYPDVEFGKTGLETVERYLPKYNLRLTSKIVLGIGAIEATSEVLTLDKQKADYIIFNNGGTAGVAFLKTAKQYGLKSKVIGAFYAGTEDVLSGSRENAKDLIVISPFSYWYEDTPGMIELRKIVKKYELDPKQNNRSFIQGWITSMICAEGLRRAGRNLTPEFLVQAYETFQNFGTGGLSQPVSYSKTDHKGGRAFKMYKTDVKKEVFIPITDFREPAFKD